MLFVLAVLLLIHGVAHVVGFVVPWRLAKLEEMPYKTTILGGRVDLGATGIRLIGVAWLVAALAFAGMALGAALDQAWWIPLGLVTSVFSLVLCVVDWPDARIGIPVNLVILLIVIGTTQGWLAF